MDWQWIREYAERHANSKAEHDDFTALADDGEELERQRDELLAALREISATVLPEMNGNTAVNIARAAIAKAEGEMG